MLGSIRKYFSRLLNDVDRRVHTKRGRSILLYLLCFLAALIMWFVVSLDEVTERDYEVPVRLVNVPDSVVVIGDVPRTVNVLLKGKGTQFLRYHVGALPVMELDFRQYNTGGNRISLSRSKLDSRLRDIFGQNVSVLAVNPDSISIGYATGSGFRIPLHINSKVSASPRSEISGPVTASVSEVSAYTIGNVMPDIDYAETEMLVIKDVADTTVCEVRIKPVPGVRFKPDRVNLTVPAELLVSKTRRIPVTCVNVPEGEKLVTYPTAVDVNYLVPMRLSNSDMLIKATVDYLTISNRSRNAGINVEAPSAECRIISVSSDSVEYVIER